MNKSYHDKTWLIKEYIDNEKSTVMIAKMCNTSPQIINSWLRKYGIKIRGSNDPLYKGRRVFKSKYEVDKNYFEKEYLSKKKTLNQIACELGCSWDTVRKLVKKFKLPMQNDKMKNVLGRERTTTEYRRFQKECLRRYGYKCAVCGYDKFVNAHHIEPFAVAENNSVENGIILCPNHHAEADYGMISTQRLYEYQQDTVRPL